MDQPRCTAGTDVQPSSERHSHTRRRGCRRPATASTSPGLSAACGTRVSACAGPQSGCKHGEQGLYPSHSTDVCLEGRCAWLSKGHKALDVRKPCGKASLCQLDGQQTLVSCCCCASISVSTARRVSSRALSGRCGVIPSFVVASSPSVVAAASISSAILQPRLQQTGTLVHGV